MGKRSLYERLPRFLRVAATMVLVLFSWVLFRSVTLSDAVAYLGTMVGLGASGDAAVMLAAQAIKAGDADVGQAEKADVETRLVLPEKVLLATIRVEKPSLLIAPPHPMLLRNVLFLIVNVEPPPE